ncbi:bifunctional tRNA (5-methylaminomethyl-2-thiouridine)(34)-methyltransferase MnmD/FAD-dependent 5-carboxymethylaminomethyl-2-thiouridine(34) oxidoreductase MnmC [Ferrimonas gelatinilytica]|uniref:tRNA 5-methylaminomethyl-2-thiouridine biosynthesis bifunctional protein MnmC n=1 Tax=Ferrimonas gelatinilytica TaxID=1255257 RepID=A0ABP9S3F0_9GAMM
MSTLTHASIDWSNPAAPVATEFDDVYFSSDDGVAETEYVFLHHSDLPKRLAHHPRRHFAVAETGFGTGLNLLVLWHHFRQFRRKMPASTCRRLHFVSVEKFPLSITDLARAHRPWPELAEISKTLRHHYPQALSDGCHRLVMDQGQVVVDLWFGDLCERLPQMARGQEGVFDAWFLDGFTPSRNPQMWQPPLYREMARLSRPGASFATFTAAGDVRRGLQGAGFEVHKAPGYGVKREMMYGTLTASVSPEATPDPEDTSPTVIIGAGIAAAALARSLCRRGKPVTLYCQDPEPAQGASGNRQGALYPLLNGGDDDLSQFYRQAFPLARAQLLSLAERYSIAHELCGVLQLPVDPRSQAKLDKIRDRGFDPALVHGVNATEASEIADLPLERGGLSYPLGGWLCPEQLTRAMLADAEATGLLTCHYQQRLTQLEYRESTVSSGRPPWQLTFNDGATHCEAQSLVLAMGAQSTAFKATSPIPLNPIRGQIAYPSAGPETRALKTVLCADGYLVPQWQGRLTCGASFGRGDDRSDLRPEDKTEIEQRMRRSFGQQGWCQELSQTGYDEGRAAVRAAVRDHLPLVGAVPDWAELPAAQPGIEPGPLPAQPGLYMVSGLGSRGLCSATLCAEILASQLCHEPLPLSQSLLAQLDPGRFARRQLRKGQAPGSGPERQD